MHHPNALVEKVNTLWNGDVDKRTCDWLTAMQKNKQEIEGCARLFREWAPLYVYTSVTRSKSPRTGFSLRFEGQEVGEIKFDGQQVLLNVSPETAENNASWYRIGMHGCWDWRDTQATEFRRAFRELPRDRPVKSMEKLIESEDRKSVV